MRQECINHKYSYGRDFPIGRLVNLVGLKMQICTQRYDRRPYGVGLLVAGYDVSFFSVIQCISSDWIYLQDQGAHIYQTCPSANYYDCKAMAIGARSQSARTYLEKHLNTFKDCELYELINHGIKALAGTLPNETKLNNKNLSICLVGKVKPERNWFWKNYFNKKIFFRTQNSNVSTKLRPKRTSILELITEPAVRSLEVDQLIQASVAPSAALAIVRLPQTRRTQFQTSPHSIAECSKRRIHRQLFWRWVIPSVSFELWLFSGVKVLMN